MVGSSGNYNFFDEERLRAIGLNHEGRFIFLVFMLRRKGYKKRLIRPISARYMHQKEIAHYEKQKDI